MPELIFSQRGEPLMRFPLSGKTTQIGRSSECDITLAGDSLSRIQLILYESEGSYLAKNAGKIPLQINGTLVESAPLRDGDLIRFADWEIRFSKGEEPEWSRDDTYVSKAGENTQLVHASFSEGRLHAEQIQLLVREPDKPERTYRIHQEITTLGKALSCDLVLADSYCSDVHCKLIVKGNRVSLFDLHSTNGSFVNGVRVREADLEDGFKITIGKTELVLEFLSEEIKIKPLKTDFFGPIVGKSPAMRELYPLLQQVAPADATVCVLGETGTGKELVARALHDLSPRKTGPWIALNCGALSRELIQSELFGHEKGAFTGAVQQRRGAFEQAHGGTLFLDEIGELPLDLQPALLRVLETGKLRRVGGNQEISVDVRLVCATHRDLSKLVATGQLREDLFFRLYVFPIFIPPLRERREDILLLSEYFLKTMTPPGKNLKLQPEAIRYLESQEWRGNVRELKNIIQRAIVLAKDGEIGVSELTLPKSSSTSTEGNSFESLPNVANLQELEKQIILRELRAQGDNRVATAKALGIAKSTLYEKLKQYGVK
jgi:DNA-binding NtrC family response regulator